MDADGKPGCWVAIFILWYHYHVAAQYCPYRSSKSLDPAQRHTSVKGQCRDNHNGALRTFHHPMLSIPADDLPTVDVNGDV